MIASVSSGRLFRGLARYLARGRDGDEGDRVAWVEARNLPTRDPEVAAKYMQADAMVLNDRVEKPVYHVALAFHPDDVVTPAMLRRAAGRLLDDLGLSEHQVMIVAHRDRAHPHVHLMVNRVHPETGVAWDRSHDYRRIEASLRAQERELGVRMVQGKHTPAPRAQEAERAAEGQARHASEARGAPDRRPARRPAELDDADRVPGPARTKGEVRRAVRTEVPALIDRARAAVAGAGSAQSWDELAAQLAAHGLRFGRKGQGLVVTDGDSEVKASRVARAWAMRALETRFGTSYEAWYDSRRSARGDISVPGGDDRADARATGARRHSGQVPGASLPSTQEERIMGATITPEPDAADRAARARLTPDSDLLEAARRMYQDPAAARAALATSVEQYGAERTAGWVRKTPELYGELAREATPGTREAVREAVARAVEQAYRGAPGRTTDGAALDPGAKPKLPEQLPDVAEVGRAVLRADRELGDPNRVNPEFAKPLAEQSGRAQFVAAKLEQYETALRNTLAVRDAAEVLRDATKVSQAMRSAAHVAVAAETELRGVAKGVWQDAAAAREAIRASVASQGVERTADAVRRAPEQFGELRDARTRETSAAAREAVNDAAARAVERAHAALAKAPTAEQIRESTQAVHRAEATAVRAEAARGEGPNADRAMRSVARGIARLDDKQFAQLTAALPEGRADLARLMRETTTQALAERSASRVQHAVERVADALGKTAPQVGKVVWEPTVATHGTAAKTLESGVLAAAKGDSAGTRALGRDVSELAKAAPRDRVAAADLAGQVLNKAVHQLAPKELASVMQAVQSAAGVATNPVGGLRDAAMAGVKAMIASREMER